MSIPPFKMEPDGEQKNTKPPWRVVFVLLFFVALAFVDRILIGLVVDPIKTSVGLDDFQIGILQGSAFAVFFLLGTIPMGWFIDRFSKRWIIFLSVIVWSSATVFFGLAGSFAGLLTARALLGLGQAAIQPASWNMVAKVFPPQRLALALSVLATGAQIGAAVSYLFGGLLIAWADHASIAELPVLGRVEPWQLAYLAIGLPGFLAAFLIFLTPREERNTEKPSQVKSEGLIVFMRRNWIFLTCHFTGFSLMCTMVYGTVAWLPTHLTRFYGMDIRIVGLILALMQFPVCATGLIFNGWRVDRAFSKGRNDAHLSHFALIAFGIAVVGCIGFSLTSSLVMLLLCYGVIQFFQPFSGVAGASLQIATPKEYRGRISAIFVMLYNAIGMTLGPSFVVFLNDNLLSGKNLGTAIGLNYVVFGILAATFLRVGCKHAAEAVRNNNE